MSDIVVFVVILLALGIGYFLGRYPKHTFAKIPSRLPWQQKRYYKGVTQLLNNDADSAIDTFIATMEVNPETLETHLALGNLLRRRGEFIRAVKVHQNLLAQPSLSLAHLRSVQLELAVDYMRSGLLDRAEQLLSELVDHTHKDKEIYRSALQYLAELYQDMKEWKQAIDVADRLTERKFFGPADVWREKQSHYCCEIAEESYREDKDIAADWARSALSYDANNVRATLIQARIFSNTGFEADALATLKKIPDQNSAYISEMLAPLYISSNKLKEMPSLLSYLKALYGEHNNGVVLNYLVRTLEKVEGVKSAVQFLVQELPNYPSLAAIGELLQIIQENPDPDYTRIKPILEKLAEDNAEYICYACGFEAESLHWLCPSCRRWNSMAIKDL